MVTPGALFPAGEPGAPCDEVNPEPRASLVVPRGGGLLRPDPGQWPWKLPFAAVWLPDSQVSLPLLTFSLN